MKLNLLLILIITMLLSIHGYAQIGAKNLLTFERATNSYYNDDYSGALKIISNNSTEIEEGKDKLLYQLYHGTLLSEMGKYKESNKYFDMAYESIITDELSDKKEFMSSFTNSLLMDFKGEIPEQILIHYYKIYNFINLNDYESALSEVNKLNSRIAFIQTIPEIKSYRGDALLFIMSGIVYEQNKKYDDALISYKKAYEIYKYDNINKIDVPEQLKKDLIRAALLSNNEDEAANYKKSFGIDNLQVDSQKGQLIVLWDNGRVSQKMETIMSLRAQKIGGSFGFINIQTGEEFPAGSAAVGLGARLLGSGITKMPYAYYSTRELKFSEGVVYAGNDSSYLSVVEDISGMLNKWHENRKVFEVGAKMTKHLSKSAGKSLAKKGLKRAASYIPGANSLSGTINSGINKVVDMAASTIEKADVRGWNLLPHKVYYTRLFLPEGDNTVTLKAKDTEGNQIEKSQKININAGQIAIAKFSTKESGEFVSSEKEVDLSAKYVGMKKAVDPAIAYDYRKELPSLTRLQYITKVGKRGIYATNVINNNEKIIQHGLTLGKRKREKLTAKYKLDESGYSPITEKVYLEFTANPRGTKKIKKIKNLPLFAKEMMIADLKSTIFPNITNDPTEADYFLTVNLNQIKAKNNYWIILLMYLPPFKIGLPMFEVNFDAYLKDKNGALIAESIQDYFQKDKVKIFSYRNQYIGYASPKKMNKLSVLEEGLQNSMGNLKRDLYKSYTKYKN